MIELQSSSDPTAVPPAGSRTPVRIAFAKPRFWSSGLLWGLGGCAAIVALATLFPEALTPAGRLLTLAGATLSAGALIGYRRWVLPRQVPDIVFRDDAIVLPAGHESAHVVTLPYPALRGLSVRGDDARLFLVIEAEGQTFVFPAHAFRDPNALEQFANELRRRMAERPDRGEMLEQMAERDESIRHIVERKTPGTHALLAIIAVAFLAQILGGALDDWLLMVRYGANVPALVAQGEWWRLVSASFLHANHFHIYLNGLALYTLGAVLERVLGTTRFLLLYLVAATAGAATSTLFTNALMSVGASTGIFGLLGALAVVNLRFRDLPLGFRQSRRWWLTFAVVNALLVLFLPGIDLHAHGGGGIAGALLALLFVRGKPSLTLAAPARSTQLALGAMVALTLVALAVAASHAASPHPAARRQLLAAWAERTRGALALNEIAWRITELRDATPEELDVAEELAQRAVDQLPDEPEIVDTLATTLYRKGETERAVGLELAALTAAPNALFAAQVHRFVDAQLAARGPVVHGDVAVSDITAAIVSDEAVGKGGRALSLRLTRDFAEGAVLVLLVKDGARRVGLMRVEIGPGHARELLLRPRSASSLIDRWPRSSTLTLAVLEAPLRKATSGVAELEAWLHDSQVDAWP